MSTEKLFKKVSEVCPLVGVVATLVNGEMAYRLQFHDDATTAQRAAAEAILGNFDPARPTVAEVKAEAGRRISERYSITKQLNIMREGGAALAEMSAYIDAVRAAGDVLETSLPADFAADAHWPG